MERKSDDKLRKKRLQNGDYDEQCMCLCGEIRK